MKKQNFLKTRFFQILFVFCLFLSATTDSQANTITLDISKANRVNNSTQRINVGTFTALVTAYTDLSSNSTGTFTTSKLERYGSSFGIISSGDESHTVDNKRGVDFILLEFSSEVSLSSIRLNAYGDTDIEVWMGNAAPGLNLSGSSFNLLSSAGFEYLGANYGDNKNRNALFDSSITGNYLIISALRGHTDDRIKISNILLNAVTNVPPPSLPPTDPIPEPASVALVLAGLVGARFRKKQL
ncbi:MAG TPA: PEP-CTERM sorting domain-containing protein [Oligoflexia bacterium]|nr:PEP-CTERM sorting domain-containing protein [Oligoflexia bacterium]HMP47562.1 PEP-CTERM sorting domain-containing protein [Oligoflexia bacterium]